MGMFLVQYHNDNDEVISKVCTEYEVVSMTNESDYLPIWDMVVYDISTLGDVKRLSFVGWQVGCLIQYKDSEGNIIISGYGEDH